MQLSRTVWEHTEAPAPTHPTGMNPAPSGERRPQLAARLSAAFVRGELTEPERLVAIEIFKCLARDSEVEVRRTLSEHIKNSPLLPRSIARELADDIEAVAIPMLQSSLVLTDEDLISVIRSGSTVKQRAIAERETLSEVVSDALVDTGKKDVVAALLANDGAGISEASYQSLLDVFADDGEIHERLVDRPALPIDIQERLVCLVADDLQARLIEKHDFPAALAEQLIQYGRERALVLSLSTLTELQEIDAAVMRLYLKGALTPTLLLRALCAGQVELFGAGLATLARIPTAKAQKALRATGSAALWDLYERARLPAHLQKAFQVVLELVLDARRPGEPAAQEEQIVLKLVQSYRDLGPDSLENVICRLGGMTASD